MPIALINKLIRTNFCHSKRYLPRLNALYVQNKLEVLCKYLMEGIVWNGSDMTVQYLWYLVLALDTASSIGLGYHI